MEEGEPACKGVGWVDIPANDLCVRPRSGLQTQDEGEGEEASCCRRQQKSAAKTRGSSESGAKSRRAVGAGQQQMTPLQHRAAARRYVGGMMRNFASVLQRWDNAMLGLARGSYRLNKIPVLAPSIKAIDGRMNRGRANMMLSGAPSTIPVTDTTPFPSSGGPSLPAATGSPADCLLLLSPLKERGRGRKGDTILTHSFTDSPSFPLQSGAGAAGGKRGD